MISNSKLIINCFNPSGQRLIAKSWLPHILYQREFEVVIPNFISVIFVKRFKEFLWLSRCLLQYGNGLKYMSFQHLMVFNEYLPR